MERLYPLLFEQNLFEKVWGGRRLKPLKGLPADDEPIGESWEVSAVEGKESVVSNGPLRGKTLRKLTTDYGADLLGRKVQEMYGDRFPLLIKLIDAEKDLSVQVHPDNDLAMQRHQSLGKTEMWFVMDATETAFLYSGFKSRINKEEYKRRVEDGSITDVLQRHEVKRGDVFFLPAGRIHAIGGGTMVAEVQQSSDVTYRIFDYNRPGLDGRPRELHTELAEDAIDYTVYNSYLTNYTERVNKPVALTECPYFTVKIHNVTRAFHRKLFKYDSFIAYLCLEGECAVVPVSDKNNAVILRRGGTCLVPACDADLHLVPKDQTAKILEVYIDNKHFN
ncbi:MAG: class I mannose-6-phosphate isomerase [Bacteroidaceae bacterium]|nr:class I mannose-6-phosphate isomerase [Bacteroidaceae bacterium]